MLVLVLGASLYTKSYAYTSTAHSEIFKSRSSLWHLYVMSHKTSLFCTYSLYLRQSSHFRKLFLLNSFQWMEIIHSLVNGFRKPLKNLLFISGLSLYSFSFHSFDSRYTFVFYMASVMPYGFTMLIKGLKFNIMILYQNAIRAVSKCYHMQIMLKHTEVPWAQQEFSRKNKKKFCKGNKFDQKQKDSHTLGLTPF